MLSFVDSFVLVHEERSGHASVSFTEGQDLLLLCL